jgi:hypothetical protein
VWDWIAAVGARTAFIEPGSPWENGYCESFNAKLRNELPDGEIFYSLAKAKTVIKSWRQHYNTRRLHSSLAQLPGQARRRQFRESRDPLAQIIQIARDLVGVTDLPRPVNPQLQAALDVFSDRFRFPPSPARDRRHGQSLPVKTQDHHHFSKLDHRRRPPPFQRRASSATGGKPEAAGRAPLLQARAPARESSAPTFTKNSTPSDSSPARYCEPDQGDARSPRGSDPLRPNAASAAVVSWSASSSQASRFPSRSIRRSSARVADPGLQHPLQDARFISESHAGFASGYPARFNRNPHLPRQVRIPT